LNFVTEDYWIQLIWKRNRQTADHLLAVQDFDPARLTIRYRSGRRHLPIPPSWPA